MSQQCVAVAKKASVILSCENRNIVSRSRKVTVYFHCALVRPHLEYDVQFWAPQFKQDVDKLGHVKRRETKMVRGWKTNSCEEGL